MQISSTRALTGTILSLAVSQVLADAAADEKRVEEVVVTGSRVSGLKAVESSSPVQVLDAADLESAGKPDLMNALANTVPSFTAQAFGGDMGEPYVFTYKDREVKLCCKGCLKDFNKEPEKYVKKMEAAEKKK